MAHYEWFEPYTGGAVLAADVAEGVLAELFIHYQDGVQVSLMVSGEDVRGVMGHHASTERTQDWPEIERFIPREEWPEEINAGLRGPSDREPDPAVLEAVAKAVKEWEESEAEAEAYEAKREARINAKRAPYTYPEWETSDTVTVYDPLRHYCSARLADGGHLVMRVDPSKSGGYVPAVLRYNKRGKRMATTRRPDEWSIIEEVYPREIWPKTFQGSRADEDTEDWPLAILIDRMVNMDMWLRMRDRAMNGGDVAALARKLAPLMERFDVRFMKA
nr:MAG TPA: hypothetical protein [Caudoviricetes sp.]